MIYETMILKVLRLRAVLMMRHTFTVFPLNCFFPFCFIVWTGRDVFYSWCWEWTDERTICYLKWKSSFTYALSLSFFKWKLIYTYKLQEKIYLLKKHIRKVFYLDNHECDINYCLKNGFHMHVSFLHFLQRHKSQRLIMKQTMW